MADTDHLLAETGLLSIKDHLGLICKQFFACSYRRDHPSHQVVQLPTGTRPGRKNIVHTLPSRYDDNVRPFLTNGVLPEVFYKRTIEAIHTKVVSECKKKLLNKVLYRVSPGINPSEISLLRISRTTLSQVRSFYNKELKSCQAKIGSSPDDVCPICQGAAHTTMHLFECPLTSTSSLCGITHMKQ
jgi:hypothetical protein